MSITNNLKKYWIFLEKKYPSPLYITKVKSVDFKYLKNAIDKNNESYLRKIIKNLYVKREAYILKNCAKQNLKNTILNFVNDYKKNKKIKFHKMLDGTPNFHRIYDKNITKKYKVYAIKHSFFLYNWNIKNRLEKKIKDEVYKHWRYIKFLSGNSKFQFEKNIPSDGQVDRLQVVRYPAGGGELRDHVDPTKNQRVVSGLIMSKIGEDFDKGGFYFRSSKNRVVNIENKLDVGDSVIFYGSIIHGVQKVDPHKKLLWNSNIGRWFVGMFVNDSDHVKNRISAKDLSGSFSLKT